MLDRRSLAPAAHHRGGRPAAACPASCPAQHPARRHRDRRSGDRRGPPDLDTAADRRRDALSEQASDAHRRERAHARAYYDDTLRSLERRREGAEPDRAELLAARAASTREERARRLAEIDEKYQARHEIRPFRLHVVAVPGWRVPLDVRRGPRRDRVDRDWLPVLGAYADEPCPRCGEPAPLSASKTRLGCIRCQPGAELHAVSASA